LAVSLAAPSPLAEKKPRPAAKVPEMALCVLMAHSEGAEKQLISSICRRPGPA
jgi:hypothetical protein